MIINQNFIIIGPSGSGKSSVARSLAKTLGMPCYDVDEVIENKYGVSSDWLIDIEGREGLIERSLLVTKEILLNKNVILSTNADSLFSKDMHSLLTSSNVVVFLKASIAKQMKKYELEHLQAEEIEEKHKSLIEFNKTLEDMYLDSSDIIIDTNNKTIKAITQIILDFSFKTSSE